MDDNEIVRALGRIEGKLGIIKSHHDRMNRIDVDVEELEERLRSVEKKQYSILVVASIVGAILGTLFKKLIG